MAKYVRKTRDRWDIQTKWGNVWATECSEYSYAEARATFRVYCANWHGEDDIRVIKVRERIG